jgi:hypothetical protein
MVCQARATLAAVAFPMHQPILVIIKHEASHEDMMADSAQDEFSDSRILDAVTQQSGYYVDDLCCAGRDLTCNQIILASVFPLSSPDSPPCDSRYTSYRRKMLSRTRAVHRPRAPPCRSNFHVVRDSAFAPLNTINGG